VADLAASDLSLDIAYIHRVDRTGYKAGALEAGQKVARASSSPYSTPTSCRSPSFSSRSCPSSSIRRSACAARWGHLNRGHSLLTRVQALMLDGHHLVENRARAAAGWLFNFSGTGGMWRKEAISSSGGWQHDTLTEDLDLSYRAQLAGWSSSTATTCSPPRSSRRRHAFRAQQYRWAKEPCKLHAS